ncbi:MAG: hypothetical protein HS113_26940 [Verrucomicrobiales bacterium]|nr:hypothetical protein [Verrucomicrobiales bacterium]
MARPDRGILSRQGSVHGSATTPRHQVRTEHGDGCQAHNDFEGRHLPYRFGDAGCGETPEQNHRTGGRVHQAYGVVE